MAPVLLGEGRGNARCKNKWTKWTSKLQRCPILDMEGRLIIGATSSYLVLVEVATSSASIVGPQSEDAIKNAHFDEQEEKELAQEVREATDSSSGRFLKGKSDGYRQRWRREKSLRRRSFREASSERLGLLLTTECMNPSVVRKHCQVIPQQTGDHHHLR